jgi:hypothetical protein
MIGMGDMSITIVRAVTVDFESSNSSGKSFTERVFLVRTQKI